jgi:hypothetical protein
MLTRGSAVKPRLRTSAILASPNELIEAAKQRVLDSDDEIAED